MTAFGGKALYLGSTRDGVEVTKTKKERIRRAVSQPYEIYNDLLDRSLPKSSLVDITPQVRGAINFAKELWDQQITEEEFCKCPFSVPRLISAE